MLNHGITSSGKQTSILSQSKSEIPAVVDAIQAQIFFLDRWGAIRDANTFARDRHEFSKLLGKTLLEESLYIENPSEMHREVMQVVRTGLSIRDSRVKANIEGRDCWFNVDKIPTSNESSSVTGVMVVLSDVSELVETSRALRESDAKYRAFIENSSDAVWCYELHPPVDTQLPNNSQVEQILRRSTLVECNNRLARLLGACSAEQLLGGSVPRNGSLAGRSEVKGFILNDYSLDRQEFSRVDRYGTRNYLQVSAKGIVENGFLSRVWGTTRDVTDQKRYLEKMEYLANHDALTSLPNRALLYNRISDTIASRGEYQKMALLFIDLDRFKEINDTLGHLAGDKVLKQLGPRLQSELGSNPGLVARLGGDEFAIFLPNLRNAQQAVVIGHRLMQCASEVFDIEGIQTEISASIGISYCPDQANDVTTLMRYADVAMYHAKTQFKGVAVYDAEIDAHSPKRLELMGALGGAIRNEQLVLHYQPKVAIDGHRVCGVEALIRWSHPQLGMIPPVEFIPTAERSSVIYPLTQWVLERALEQCAQWCERGIYVPVSINISARNLADDKLVEDVTELLSRYQVPTGILEFEITESAVMADQKRALCSLEKLSKLGIRLSIDDYGTGYSSLAYLKKLPVDTLKIDASFVLGMAEENSQDEIIVSSTINLAHNLGLDVVAEGVETECLYNRLVSLGCDSAQGYFIAKPMPVSDLDQWFVSSPWPVPKA